MKSIHAPSRLMPDPPSRRGGILTKGELAACLRVLGSLRTPQGASLVLSWGLDDQEAYASLHRAGYVYTLPCTPVTKLSAPFRWDQIAATPAGLAWARQCGAADTGSP